MKAVNHLHLLKEGDDARFWSKVSVSEGCWEWLGSLSGGGYGQFYLQHNKRTANVKAHRISWALSNGQDPEDLFVLHTCDNRRCVNPAHLFLGTHQDNMEDRNRKGRQARQRGEACGTAKLTTSQVREIRNRQGAGESQRSLAKEYGVGQQTISRIVNRRRWAHI